jgi:hypothetical protein
VEAVFGLAFGATDFRVYFDVPLFVDFENVLSELVFDLQRNPPIF